MTPEDRVALADRMRNIASQTPHLLDPVIRQWADELEEEDQ